MKYMYTYVLSTTINGKPKTSSFKSCSVQLNKSVRLLCHYHIFDTFIVVFIHFTSINLSFDIF